ncbi:MopE-related protein [Thermodesulfobacteriota bacterium]
MKKNKLLEIFSLSIVTIVLFQGGGVVFAENIDPDNDDSQYAWGENVGWLNLEPGGDGGSGVEVGEFWLTGTMWGENIGWINLSPSQSGVFNDGNGNLSGYAWGENTGWINFAPAGGGVYIDACGDFNGTAWGENIGWIRFRSEGAHPFVVRSAWVSPIDSVAPETEPDSPVEDWYTADVSITLSATDCGSGVREVHYILDSGEEVITSGSTVAMNVTTEGCHTLVYYSVDEDDNIEDSNEVSFCVDKTPPTITLTSPTEGADYYINDTVLADYTVTDPNSGVATVTATVSDGEPIHTSTIGTHAFTVTASDNVGNSDSVTHTYTVSYPGNIDPDDDGSQFAWGENTGWIDFDPPWGPGVTVNDTALVGYAWGENIGWINLSPTQSGVTNDGTGNLSGYGWGENTGWISFSCENTASCGAVDYRVVINPVTGLFGGYAWGENIGWINFSPAVGGGAKTSWGECWDNDGDGYEDEICGGDDCDDGDAGINPGENENCNDGIDNDCDGLIDGTDPGCQAECTDNDVDGYGSPASALCLYPEFDCNDNHPFVNPGADENCTNLIDDDCDGIIDGDDPECTCTDNDVDGYYIESHCPGDPDCNDNNEDIYPGADDPCDEIDQDCDGTDGVPEILGNGIDDDCDDIIDESIFIPTDYPTIQDGINAAVNGDVILVAPDTYIENINFMGKAITVLGEEGADATVIDGNQAGSVVSFVNGETQSAILEDFTITNGTGTNDKGGGIYCENYSSPTIKNCIISNNSAAYQGGGINCYNRSSATITNCKIFGNNAGKGGGICCNWSSPTIVRCTISGNNDDDSGGGIYCEGAESSPMITNCIISGNSTALYGGGICSSFGSSPTITNCTISDNSSGAKGGGIVANNSSSAIVINSILWGNSAPEGTQIWIGFTFAHSTFTVSYSDVQDVVNGEGWGIHVETGCTLNWLGGNINTNPFFLGGGNYYLRDELPDYVSPCIDAGNPEPAYNDICLPPSLGTVRNDMGAYGGPDACGGICWDNDEDSYSDEVCGGTDCDDSDPDVNPGADEVCDGKDNNCVDGIDEEPAASDFCNNGLFCDGEEYCDAGSCQTGTPPDCADAVTCTNDTCNEDTDSCDHTPNDGLCDDSLWCNGAETCDEVNDCQAGTAPDCDDGVGCTVDTCNEETDGCDHTPNDSLCDDGAYCNGVETCNSVSDCQGGTAVDCDDSVSCTVDSCNEGTDSCDNVPDDGLCIDGNVCTDDTCNPDLGCVYTNNTDPCDDMLFCSGTDTCMDGTCSHSGNPCDPVMQICNEDLEICENLECGIGYLCVTCYLNGHWTGSSYRPDTIDIELHSGKGDPTAVFPDVPLDEDCVASVELVGINDDLYEVVARHLNHIDLASDGLVFLSMAESNPVDFSGPGSVACGESALIWEASNGGKWTMPGGDASGDGNVNIFDYFSMGQQWGGSGPESDYTGDGAVNIFDYFILGQNWGRSDCPDVP